MLDGTMTDSNIICGILILIINHGWYCTAFTIKTPTINYYANKGIILENYYVQPICTPTRAALMSGRYPINVGLQHGVIRDSVPDALPLKINNKSVVIMPEYLKNHATYETHMIGKWHLGLAAKNMTP
eukprot:207494_1